MAAAPDNRLVCFVNVDPSFQVVLDAINELEKNERLQPVCTVTVGNNRLQSASTDNHDEFGGRYGFARTLGSTLRAFMLRSTYLEAQHDPPFEGRVPNLCPKAGYSRAKYVAQNDGNPLELSQDKATAEDISASFDRLYPHFSTENKLAKVDQGSEAGPESDVNLSGMMVIVELQGGDIVKLHTINTTVVAKQHPQNSNTFECLNPKVERITAKVLDSDFPNCKMIKDMILKVNNGNAVPDANIKDRLKNLRNGIEEKESHDEDGSLPDPKPKESADPGAVQSNDGAGKNTPEPKEEENADTAQCKDEKKVEDAIAQLGKQTGNLKF